MVRAALQQVFVQTDEKSAHATWREVASQLEKSNPAGDDGRGRSRRAGLLQLPESAATQSIKGTLPDRKAGTEFTPS